MFDWVLKKVLGTKHEREIKKLQPLVDAVNALEPKLRKLSDADLQARTAEFRRKLDRGASLDELLVPAFATVREASRRVLGMRHYDVQLIGGAVLHQGKIAEMKTGEGKTLVATLPVYLNALEGKGVHVVTVNDYLAQRDAEWMGRVYHFLGMSVGVVVPRQGEAAKKRAYRADITYGQNNEFGFDYLRDNMKFSIYDYVQRDLHFAIVDEVDSILIDEARTPLIISGPGETASEKYTLVAELMPRFRKDEHYLVDEKAHSVTLTDEGVDLAQQLLLEKGLLETPNLYDPVNLQTLHILTQSLKAHTLYKRDQHYMVTPEGKVLIIDEFTGRVLPGRRWSDGLHQAVEAKERVPIQSENVTLATISFQNLFRLYKKLAGMTGTADTEAAEFHKIYKLDVVVIPTNKPVVRKDYDDVIYKTEREKFRAVAEEIQQMREAGRPVLVGTTSVEKSEALARLLEKRGVPHEVLNAKQHEREAYIVAQAGRAGAVTIATNMAGRGTDILLGGNPEMLAKEEVLTTAPEEVLQDSDAFERAVAEATEKYERQCEQEKKAVLAAGGLHIVGTERHESRRVDNQLRGRAGRQGDPGSSRFFLSLEDDLMRIFAGDRLQTFMDRLGMEEDVPIEHPWVTKAVENAQKKVEERNFDIRKNMLEYDDVLNQQRKSIYALRRQVLLGLYRTIPTEEEARKGVEPTPIVTEPEETLAQAVAPILEQMVKFHATPLPPAEASEEEVEAFRERARQARIEELRQLRWQVLEQDVYAWFGYRAEQLQRYAEDPKGALSYLQREVALSVTEQWERLLDLVDEMVGTMVERACPPGKHHEDWDLKGLATAYEEQFGIRATGLDRLADAEAIAKKLYDDAERVLRRKRDDLGVETFLRLFRNFYLEQIDRQWIEHLQAMDHLRDGIGLRGYGQRDPKREYKLEGYEMFRRMMEGIKGEVAARLFRVERVRTDELEAIEARRKAEAEKRLRRAASPGAEGAASEGRSAPRRKPRARPLPAGAPGVTIQRKGRKIGRNEPCWCGSGKKYKHCHFEEDRRAVPM